MKRQLKTIFKKNLRRLFELMQSAGMNILPSHFYSQIPVISDLKKDSYWKAPYTLIHIKGTDTKQQLSFVNSCVSASLSKDLLKMKINATAVVDNGEDGGFGIIESDFLYAFIVTMKPSKIIQVGCGVSTSIILRACKDAGYNATIICIEPFPMKYLVTLSERGAITLIREMAQKVDVGILTDLEPNDFLFVDSTHTVKPGSEVNKIILEVLPRLKKDVWVHFHDIYFPYDYTPDILTKDLFFWSESILLQAFLVQNPYYTIRACFSMLHYAESEGLKNIFLQYKPLTNDMGLSTGVGEHFPASLYLQVV